MGEEKEDGEEEADEGGGAAEDEEGADVWSRAVAEGVADEVWVGLVAEGGVEHFLDRGEGGWVGCVFEGAQDGGAIVVREVQLPRGARGEVVVDDPGDLGAQWLRLGRVPDVLVRPVGFDGRDGEFNVVQRLGVLVRELGDFVPTPGVAVGYVLAHDVDVVGCNHPQAILLLDRRGPPCPPRRQRPLHLRHPSKALEVVYHPEVELQVFGIVRDVGEVLEEVLEGAGR